MIQHESDVVDVQSVFVFEDSGRNRTRRRGWESVLKISPTNVVVERSKFLLQMRIWLGFINSVSKKIPQLVKNVLTGKSLSR